MYRNGKGLISVELNGLDSRFNGTRFLNMGDAQKVLLHTLVLSSGLSCVHVLLQQNKCF